MNGFLAFLFDIARKVIRPAATFHDDSQRANQGDRDPGFSFWRALVS